MPRLNAILFLSLAISSAPAFGQGAGQAVPGTVNYVEGTATLNGRALSTTSVGKAVLKPGQFLQTEQGRAEILLTPGIFLRLDNHSAVMMVSPDLTHTEVEIDRGRVEVEVDQIFKQNYILIDQKNAGTQLLQPGLYGFDANKQTMRVFKGKAAVFAGTGGQPAGPDSVGGGAGT